MIKYDLNLLDNYVLNGLVARKEHDEKPLYIYNYTRACQYSKYWDEVTKLCRGLIVDMEGNYVARGFKKFFNHFEISDFEQTYGKEVPVSISRKEDGVLGILFYFGGWELSTRGMFGSSPALTGNRMVKELIDTDKLNKNITYLVEIISPNTRICLNYGSEQNLYLLGMVDQDGNDLNDELERLKAIHAGFAEVIQYGDSYTDSNPNHTPWSESEQRFYTSSELVKIILSNPEENSEGWVMSYPNSDRVKIKYQEYFNLAKLQQGITYSRIMDLIIDGTFGEWVVRLDEEMSIEAQKIRNDIINRYLHIEETFKELYENIYEVGISRKDLALKLQAANIVSGQGIIFRMFDGKEYDTTIWTMVKNELKNVKQIV